MAKLSLSTALFEMSQEVAKDDKVHFVLEHEAENENMDFDAMVMLACTNVLLNILWKTLPKYGRMKFVKLAQNALIRECRVQATEFEDTMMI